MLLSSELLRVCGIFAKFPANSLLAEKICRFWAEFWNLESRQKKSLYFSLLFGKAGNFVTHNRH
jgi:hypothetical protein